MRGEQMELPKLARLLCEHAENVFDDVDMGTITAATLREARAVREEAISLVDKLNERNVKE